MSTYVIGDVQGCYDELRQLLEKIQFDEQTDYLWFVGDLVNRGPDSLSVLRFIKSLGDRQVTVLGNHDLHLLAVAEGVRSLEKKDTLDAVLVADDRDELLFWLRHQPFLHANDRYVMTHAGIYPKWTLDEAVRYARELESVLRGDDWLSLIADFEQERMGCWSNELTDQDRYRFLISVFTSIRFCYPDGRLEFREKGPIGSQPEPLIPWFDLMDLAHCPKCLIVGHWAALKGEMQRANLILTDTGCVWGGTLTAVRLEDQRRFSVMKEKANGF